MGRGRTTSQISFPENFELYRIFHKKISLQVHDFYFSFPFFFPPHERFEMLKNSEGVRVVKRIFLWGKEAFPKLLDVVAKGKIPPWICDFLLIWKKEEISSCPGGSLELGFVLRDLDFCSENGICTERLGFVLRNWDLYSEIGIYTQKFGFLLGDWDLYSEIWICAWG